MLDCLGEGQVHVSNDYSNTGVRSLLQFKLYLYTISPALLGFGIVSCDWLKMQFHSNFNSFQEDISRCWFSAELKCYQSYLTKLWKKNLT